MAVVVNIPFGQAVEAAAISGQTAGVSPAKQQMNKSQATRSVAATTGVVLSTMVAKQTLSYATSNIGKYTGNSRTQARVNIAKSFVGTAANIGGSIATSLATGNPVPFLVTMTSETINTVTSVTDSVWNIRWDEAKSTRSLIRAGYNSSGQLIGRRH